MLNDSNNQKLLNAAHELGIEISAAQTNSILLYLEQLNKWNKTYNLTSIRDKEQMLIQHAFDSLSVIPVLRNILKNKDEPKIIDVGSGGGLPGIIIAIMGIGNVHCVDTVSKKASFIQQMSSVLSLKNLYAHHSRIENLNDMNADIIVSRAFASLYDFVNLSHKHLKDDGCFIAMKGQLPEEEIQELQNKTNYKVINITDLKVPELNANRCAIEIRLKD